MSRRDRYPEIDKWHPHKGRSQKLCGVLGCDKESLGAMCVRFTYMRGEDETVWLCGEHSQAANANIKSFCLDNNWKEGAWK